MQRRVDLRWRLRADSLPELCQLQMEILRRTASFLKPGGTLVYSTCSLEPEENEEAVQQFLLEFPNWHLAEQRVCRPFVNHFDGAFAAKIVRPAAE